MPWAFIKSQLYFPQHSEFPLVFSVLGRIAHWIFGYSFCLFCLGLRKESRILKAGLLLVKIAFLNHYSDIYDYHRH